MAFGAVWFACRESGYLWRRRRLHWLGIGGSSLHTLRSGYVPCCFLAPASSSSSCGGEAEKALIISIDCASSRARDTAASGQQRPRGWHCPEPIILKTGRLPRITRRPHTHSSQITPTLIGAEELCSASVHFLSGMAVDAALSSVSGDKEEKAACSSNRGRVGPKLEVGSASLRPI